MKSFRIAALALAAAGALAALVLIPVTRSTAQGGGGPFDDVANHYSCYNITDHQGFTPTDARMLDQFGLSVGDVLEPVLLCNPVSKDQGEVPEPDWHLVCYDLLVDQDPEPHDVSVDDQYDTETLSTLELELLCLPSSKTEL
ncbi:MAG: DUF7450 family protein [Candidatus Rokuibacteriota bacterium]